MNYHEAPPASGSAAAGAAHNDAGNYYLGDGVPGPADAPNGFDGPFWEATRRHELVVERCNICGKFRWEPELICDECHSFDMGWTKIEPRGRLYSWERSWYPVHPALVNSLPYIVVTVELPQAGGVRMVGNLLGDPLQEVRIDSEVEAVFEDHPEYTLVQWRVVE